MSRPITPWPLWFSNTFGNPQASEPTFNQCRALMCVAFLNPYAVSSVFFPMLFSLHETPSLIFMKGCCYLLAFIPNRRCWIDLDLWIDYISLITTLWGKYDQFCLTVATTETERWLTCLMEHPVDGGAMENPDIRVPNLCSVTMHFHAGEVLPAFARQNWMTPLWECVIDCQGLHISGLGSVLDA